MYYMTMKIRKFCFIAFLFILPALAAAEEQPTPEEVQHYIPFWDANKEIFSQTHVYQCVGNEDNSLFLLNVTTDESWHNIIYAFSPDSYWEDKRIYKIWDQSVSGGDVRSLVYSPFSKKFYFTASWENSSDLVKNNCGLWSAIQTKKKWEPVLLNHQQMECGLGFLVINKMGVWLLHDNEPNWDIDDRFLTSTLYQIEDNKGRYIFKTPKALKDVFFHSYWSFENPVNVKIEDSNIKHEHEVNLRNTDYTLILRDRDADSWWVFDCTTEKAEKYENYDVAKKQALFIDNKYVKKELFIKSETPFQISLQILFVIFFLISLISIITLLIHRDRKFKRATCTLKEHNKMIFDIQEKERAKISRDIHDSVVQDIRVLRLETENLNVDENSKQKQSKIAELATDCIIKLRNICYNLTPAELASYNEGDSSKFELISIINSLVQQFCSRTHIPCIFKVEEGFEYPVLGKEKTQNVFRVIQESLTNIEKHSYATQASIYMKKDGNALSIYITDDGIGCNQDELNKKLKSKEHLGLRSMKDRIELIGGSIDFFTSQSDGMEIKINLPLENE